jgi:hypothetical protein
MNDSIKQSLSDIVLSCKANAAPETRLAISVLNPDGKFIGRLACVDRGGCADPELISSLTAWRQKFMRFFLTQFEATGVRTQSWLETVVLPAPDRLLFVIVSESGEAIGNFGLCDLTETSGELDNLIRGRKGGDPKLIYYSELALLSWLFGRYGHEEARLHVFSNNYPTLRLHASVGFSVAETIRISKKCEPGMIRYLLDSDEGEPLDFSYLKMTISKEVFLDRHPWIRSVYVEHWQ